MSGFAKPATLFGGNLTETLARLLSPYIVEIPQVVTGNEWALVGQDLAKAIEECEPEVDAVKAEHKELVEA